MMDGHESKKKLFRIASHIQQILFQWLFVEAIQIRYNIRYTFESKVQPEKMKSCNAWIWSDIHITHGISK